MLGTPRGHVMDQLRTTGWQHRILLFWPGCFHGNIEVAWMSVVSPPASVSESSRSKDSIWPKVQSGVWGLVVNQKLHRNCFLIQLPRAMIPAFTFRM